MYRQREVAAVVVAAGKSSRMGFDKMLHKINGVEVLRRTVERMAAHPYIDRIVVVAGENRPAVEALFAGRAPTKPLEIVTGGATRTSSVAAGVNACAGAALVAVHDGARPFVSADVISRTIEAAAETSAAAPGVPVKDTIKQVESGLVVKTCRRDRLVAIQTPQVFERRLFLSALAQLPEEEYGHITDDCMVMERMGYPVKVVPGDYANQKITGPEDLPEEAQAVPAQNPHVAAVPRIGHGYDVHRLVHGRELIMGGVKIPYEKGLLGHSDADVLLHAVADALLGAVALGDIGQHFPDNDPTYKGASSLLLLKHVGGLLHKKGCRILNIDATLLCQAPKLAPHIPAMRGNIAVALGIEAGQVSVKATTEERLGFTGSGEGIAAHCVAMVQEEMVV